MQNILVLGGTQFVGRTIVERLVTGTDHRITLFNRGISNTSLFPRLAKLTGDRENPADLEKIFGHRWDVVIDCSGYMPDSIKQIVQRIDTGHYIFISTISVYDFDKFDSGLIEEDFPLLDCTHEQRVDQSMSTYGERKAACEREITTSEINYTIMRPSIIFGPYDHTDRMYYWYYRIKNGFSFLMPETEEQIGITYMADLAEAVLLAIEKEPQNSICNAATHTVTLKKIIQEMANSLQLPYNAEFKTIRQIAELDLKPWSDLPYFVNAPILCISSKKLANELPVNFTPFDKAIADTIEYFKTLDSIPRYGLSLEKEAGLV